RRLVAGPAGRQGLVPLAEGRRELPAEAVVLLPRLGVVGLIRLRAEGGVPLGAVGVPIAEGRRELPAEAVVLLDDLGVVGLIRLRAEGGEEVLPADLDRVVTSPVARVLGGDDDVVGGEVGGDDREGSLLSGLDVGEGLGAHHRYFLPL